MEWLLLGGILGGLVGGISQIFTDVQSVQEFDRTVGEGGYIDTDLANKKKQMDAEYAIAKKQANREADKQDKQTTRGESTLSDNISAQTAMLNLEQAMSGLSLNTSETELGQSYGASLASMSSNGTRSSSLNQAVEMQAALSTAQIESQKEAGRNSYDFSLKNIIDSMANGVFDIQTSRDDTNYLRNSYEAGGAAYESYQANLTYLNDQAKLEKRRLADSFKDWQDNTGLRYLNAIFNGATTGFNATTKVLATGDDFGWWNISNYNPGGK